MNKFPFFCFEQKILIVSQFSPKIKFFILKLNLVSRLMQYAEFDGSVHLFVLEQKYIFGRIWFKKSKLFIFYHGVSRLHIETDVDAVHLE